MKDVHNILKGQLNANIISFLTYSNLSGLGSTLAHMYQESSPLNDGKVGTSGTLGALIII